MLKNIPQVIPPDLLKYLAEMGHGDDIVLADANFPGANCAKRIVRCDGIKIPQLLRGILALMPLDNYVEHPVTIMNVRQDINTPLIWLEYEKILEQFESDAFRQGFAKLERFEFYEAAKSAYVVVQSGETAIYANIILKKGVITE